MKREKILFLFLLTVFGVQAQVNIDGYVAGDPTDVSSFNYYTAPSTGSHVAAMKEQQIYSEWFPELGMVRLAFVSYRGGSDYAANGDATICGSEADYFSVNATSGIKVVKKVGTTTTIIGTLLPSGNIGEETSGSFHNVHQTNTTDYSPSLSQSQVLNISQDAGYHISSFAHFSRTSEQSLQIIRGLTGLIPNFSNEYIPINPRLILVFDIFITQQELEDLRSSGQTVRFGLSLTGEFTNKGCHNRIVINDGASSYPSNNFVSTWNVPLRNPDANSTTYVSNKEYFTPTTFELVQYLKEPKSLASSPECGKANISFDRPTGSDLSDLNTWLTSVGSNSNSLQWTVDYNGSTKTYINFNDIDDDLPFLQSNPIPAIENGSDQKITAYVRMKWDAPSFSKSRFETVLNGVTYYYPDSWRSSSGFFYVYQPSDVLGPIDSVDLSFVRPLSAPSAVINDESNCAQRTVSQTYIPGTDVDGELLVDFGVELQHDGSGSTKEFLVWRSDTTLTSNVTVDILDSLTENGSYKVQGFVENQCGVRSYSPVINTQNLNNLNISSKEPDISLLTDAIRLNWDSIETSIRSLTLRRKNSENGSTEELLVNDNDTLFYYDEAFTTCIDYQYQLVAENACKTSSSLWSDTIRKPYEDIDGFLVGNDVNSSKGEQQDRVQMQVDYADEYKVDEIEIYRKNITQNDSSFLKLNKLDAGDHVFNDFNATQGELYQYMFVPKKVCGGVIYRGDSIYDYGFSRNSALISGNVSYSGNQGVEGVRVEVKYLSGYTNKALKLGGTASLQFVNSSISSTDTLLFETMVKTESNLGGAYQDLIVFEDVSSSNILKLQANNSNIRLRKGVTSNQTTSYTSGSWVHVAVLFDRSENEIGFYIDGALVGTLDFTAGINTIQSRIPASGRSANLWLDETRLRRNPIMDEEDYLTILSSNAAGLVYCYSYDDGPVPMIFDRSKTNQTFNRRHLTIASTDYSWQSVGAPSPAQLKIQTRTNSQGDYVLNYVPFTGNGAQIQLLPSFGTHTFSPNSTTLFINQSSYVFNQKDFEDESSFEFKGRITYLNPEDKSKNTFIPVEGAQVKIDNQVALVNGSIIETDANGEFEIQVPIGDHSVSVSKTNHTMAVGRFPNDTGLYSFQTDYPGIFNFSDSTTLLMRGKVLGGYHQMDTYVDSSHNNIGVAYMSIKSNLYNGKLHRAQTYTDSSSGDYTFKLLPLTYIVDTVDVVSNADLTYVSSSSEPSPFGQMSMINMANELATKYWHTNDSTINDFGNRVALDSVAYNFKKFYIYQAPPKVEVYQEIEDSLYSQLGDLSHDFNDLKFDSITYTVHSSSLGYPFFDRDSIYNIILRASEQYVNHDGTKPKIENNAIAGGKWLISDNIGTFGATGPMIIEMPEDSPSLDTLYALSPKSPSTTVNQSFKSRSFTQTLAITYQTKNDAFYKWEVPSSVLGRELEPSTGTLLRGVVVGSVADPTKNNFYSTPEKVDFVLRDPPGSNSFASISSGTEVATTVRNENITGGGFNVESWIFAGADFSAGLGMAVNTEIKAGYFGGNTSIFSNGNSSETIDVQTFQTTISTSDDPDWVGANADVYFARARNYNYGLAQKLVLMPDSLKESSLFTPSDKVLKVSVNGSQEDFQLALMKVIYVNPAGFGTYSYYTQSHILNNLIPTLRSIRNQYLASHPHYISHVSIDSLGYGKNNDDDFWGTNATSDPIDYVFADTTGLSYTFYASRDSSSIDSVRFYNEQIKAWQNAIALNEEQKAKAQDPYVVTPNTLANISFSSNVTYENSVSSLNETTKMDIDVVDISGFVGYKGELSVNGLGTESEASALFELSQTRETSTTNQQSKEISFTLEDDDLYDYYSVDILEAEFSPVFKIKGGQTQCPYEGPTNSLFYQPSGSPVNLSGGTTKLERPKISVANNVQGSIPDNSKAVFQLTLENEGDVYGDYELFVDNTSNPKGAIVKIDGISPNQDYYLDTATAINKVLTIECGPFYYDYEDIRIIFRSKCDVTIADTVTVSAYFLPTCTDVVLAIPSDNWVGNIANKDTINLLIKEFDRNYKNFNFLQVQYKESTSPAWLELVTYYKDSASYPAPTIPSGTYFLNPNEGNIRHPWEIKQVLDGNYDIRVLTDCSFDGITVQEQTDIVSGIIDTEAPAVFGTPKPADGILSAGEDIYLRFTENIDKERISSLTDIQVKSILNGGTRSHYNHLQFNGTTDYVKLPPVFDFRAKDFSIDGWINVSGSGHRTILQQGNDTTIDLEIFINDSDLLGLRMGGSTVFVQTAVPNSQWVHFNVSRSVSNEEITIGWQSATATDSKTTAFYPLYDGTGDIYLGKSLTGNYFSGKMVDFRLWNTYKPNNDYYLKSELSPTVSGLMAWYPFDEGIGIVSKERLRSRDAEVQAQWGVEQPSYALEFTDTSDYTYFLAGEVSFTNEQDFTIEHWFNIDSSSNTGVIWNFGSGDLGWELKHIGDSLKLVQGAQSFDLTSGLDFNKWHHFALVVDRKGSVKSYLNSNLVWQQSALVFNGAAAAYFGLGAKVYLNPQLTVAGHFKGKIDEFRLWNSAKSINDLERYKFHRLQEDFNDLISYFPFDEYELSPFGITQSPENHSQLVSDSALHASLENASSLVYTTSTAPIAMELPEIELVNSFLVNGDEMIIEVDEDAWKLENQTMRITVSGIRDDVGNKLASAESWIAFHNKNQVLWFEDSKELLTRPDSTISFTTKIINTGGESRFYEISNIPDFMTVTPNSGTLSPVSEQVVTIELDQGINVGDQEIHLFLTTNYGYKERYAIDLKVRKSPPQWEVDPAQYPLTMNFIGQIKVDGVISQDPEDIVGAFYNDSCIGVTNIELLQAKGDYYGFLTVYGDSTMNGELIEFKVWDASIGKVHTQVLPNNEPFNANGLRGTLSSPVFWEATHLYEVEVPLHQGWNWLSFTNENVNQTNVDYILGNIDVNNSSVLLRQDAFTTVDDSLQWLNFSTGNSGIENEQSYLLKSIKNQSLFYDGSIVDVTNQNIVIDEGWNWLGFTSQRSMSVGEALANLNASSGDIIKGQYSFAVYDSLSGWVGSLKFLSENEGYKYLNTSTSSKSFGYPNSAMYPNVYKNGAPKGQQSQMMLDNVNVYDYQDNISVRARIIGCPGDLRSGDLSFMVKDDFGTVLSVALIEELQSNVFEAYFTIVGEVQSNLHLIAMNNATGEEYEVDFILDNTEFSDFYSSQVILQDTMTCRPKIQTNGAPVVVYPNPTSNLTTLYFEIDESVDVEISIYTMNGIELWEDKYSINEGDPYLDLFLKEILPSSSSGPLRISIQSDSWTQTNIIIKI